MISSTEDDVLACSNCNEELSQRLRTTPALIRKEGPGEVRSHDEVYLRSRSPLSWDEREQLAGPRFGI